MSESAGEAAMRDMYAGYWANVPPNIILTMRDPFDDEVLSIVRNIPEVAEVEGRSVVNARVQADGEWIAMLLVVRIPSQASATLPGNHQEAKTVICGLEIGFGL